MVYEGFWAIYKTANIFPFDRTAVRIDDPGNAFEEALTGLRRQADVVRIGIEQADVFPGLIGARPWEAPDGNRAEATASGNLLGTFLDGFFDGIFAGRPIPA